jgi:hypothetical protein
LQNEKRIVVSRRFNGIVSCSDQPSAQEIWHQSIKAHGADVAASGTGLYF